MRLSRKTISKTQLLSCNRLTQRYAAKASNRIEQKAQLLLSGSTKQEVVPRPPRKYTHMKTQLLLSNIWNAVVQLAKVQQPEKENPTLAFQDRLLNYSQLLLQHYYPVTQLLSPNINARNGMQKGL